MSTQPTTLLGSLLCDWQKRLGNPLYLVGSALRLGDTPRRELVEQVAAAIQRQLDGPPPIQSSEDRAELRTMLRWLKTHLQQRAAQ